MSYVRVSRFILIGNTDFLVDFEVSDDEILIEAVRVRDIGKQSFSPIDIGTIGCLAVMVEGQWVPLYDRLVELSDIDSLVDRKRACG